MLIEMQFELGSVLSQYFRTEGVHRFNRGRDIASIEGIAIYI